MKLTLTFRFVLALVLCGIPVSLDRNIAQAQSVTHLCGTVYEDQLPSNIEGSLFIIANDAGITVLREVTSSGLANEYQVPMSVNEFTTSRLPIISPDQRLVAFRPYESGDGLLIWDIVNDSTLEVQLDSQLADYLRGANISYAERISGDYPNYLAWVDARTLAVRYLDGRGGNRLTDIQEINVSENLMSAQIGPITAVTTQAAGPIPEGYSFLHNYFAQGEDYVAVTSHTPRLQRRLQVFEIDSTTPLYEDISSETSLVMTRPYWLDGGQQLFYVRIIVQQGSSFIMLRADQDFAEDTTLSGLLHQELGTRVSYLGLTSTSENGESVSFLVNSSPDEQTRVDHMAIFTPESGLLKLLCTDGGSYNIGSNFWLYNEYIVIVTSAGITIFDTNTGDIYKYDGYIIGRSPEIIGGID